MLLAGSPATLDAAVLGGRAADGPARPRSGRRSRHSGAAPASAPRASSPSCAAAGEGPYPLPGPVDGARRRRPCRATRASSCSADQVEASSTSSNRPHRRLRRRASVHFQARCLRAQRPSVAVGTPAGPSPDPRADAGARRRSCGCDAMVGQLVIGHAAEGTATVAARPSTATSRSPGRGPVRPGQRADRGRERRVEGPVRLRRPRPRARDRLGLSTEHRETVLVGDGSLVGDVVQLVAACRSTPSSATRISTSSGFISWVKTWPRYWA